MKNKNTEIAQFGKDSVLYFRLLKNAESEAAAKLALQIEHTLNSERSSESIMTKDGPINTPGSKTNTLELTAVSTLDDVNKMLYAAYQEGEILECWEVNLSDPRGDAGSTGEQKFGAKYMQGILQNWSLPKAVEGTVDISTTFNINFEPQDGEVTVSKADQDAIQYAFRDLEKYKPQI